MNGGFIPLELVEGLGSKVWAMAPQFDIVLRALINAPEGLHAVCCGFSAKGKAEGEGV